MSYSRGIKRWFGFQTITTSFAVNNLQNVKNVIQNLQIVILSTMIYNRLRFSLPNYRFFLRRVFRINARIFFRRQTTERFEEIFTAWIRWEISKIITRRYTWRVQELRRRFLRQRAHGLTIVPLVDVYGENVNFYRSERQKQKTRYTARAYVGISSRVPTGTISPNVDHVEIISVY